MGFYLTNLLFLYIKKHILALSVDLIGAWDWFNVLSGADGNFGAKSSEYTFHISKYKVSA